MSTVSEQRMKGQGNHGNDYNNSWGSQQMSYAGQAGAGAGGHSGQRKPYDDYHHRNQGAYHHHQQGHDGIKNVEHGMQGLGLGHHDREANHHSSNSLSKSDQHHQQQKEAPKKMTWASIASQPAKPQVNTTSTTVKKKGPGMPPPPMVPGKHNMDIGTWDSPSKNGPNAMVPTPTPPPIVPPPVIEPSPLAEPPISAGGPGKGMNANNGPPQGGPGVYGNQHQQTSQYQSHQQNMGPPAGAQNSRWPTPGQAQNPVSQPQQQQPQQPQTHHQQQNQYGGDRGSGLMGQQRSEHRPYQQNNRNNYSGPPQHGSSQGSGYNQPPPYHHQQQSTIQQQHPRQNHGPAPAYHQQQQQQQPPPPQQQTQNQHHQPIQQQQQQYQNDRSSYQQSPPQHRQPQQQHHQLDDRRNNGSHSSYHDGHHQQSQPPVQPQQSQQPQPISPAVPTSVVSVPSTGNESSVAASPPGPSPEILDQLQNKNKYNPVNLDILDTAHLARFFVIKSYSEDDIHRSIKYEIWCSTEHGNQRLDQAYRERDEKGGMVYLFFSVNGSGHFCGIAEMMTAVDYNSNSSVWSQDKWKGTFKVRWIYVKDVPNGQLRHVKLENNENKPITNSRDTQEVPNAKGIQALKIIHSYKHTMSIFDDFVHYEKRQLEEDHKKHDDRPQYRQYGGSYDGQNKYQNSYNKYNDREGGDGYNSRAGYDRGGYSGGYNRGYGGYNNRNNNRDGGYQSYDRRNNNSNNGSNSGDDRDAGSSNYQDRDGGRGRDGGYEGNSYNNRGSGYGRRDYYNRDDNRGRNDYRDGGNDGGFRRSGGDRSGSDAEGGSRDGGADSYRSSGSRDHYRVGN